MPFPYFLSKNSGVTTCHNKLQFQEPEQNSRKLITMYLDITIKISQAITNKNRSLQSCHPNHYLHTQDIDEITADFSPRGRESQMATKQFLAQ